MQTIDKSLVMGNNEHTIKLIEAAVNGCLDDQRRMLPNTC